MPAAQLAVKVHEDVDLNKAYAAFKQQALPIAATSLTHGSVPLNHAALSQNMVWVFGSEGQGISAISQDAADQLIHIPMQEEGFRPFGRLRAAGAQPERVKYYVVFDKVFVLVKNV